MTEGINNNINPDFLYKKQEKALTKNAEQEDTSVFENKETDELKKELKSAQDEQGWIGNIWNGIKNLSGIGSSSEKCEEKIQAYEKGEISKEDVQKEISEFRENQEEAVETATNIASGVAAVGAAVLTGATGGIALPLTAGAMAGALTKTTLNISDRATNETDGDVLDENKIIKDGLTGALDGAVSAATMGIGAGILSNSVKSALIQGAKTGITAGTISGSVTGAGEYTIETVLDDNKEFSVSELAEKTVSTGIAGALTGGFLGAGANAVKFFKPSPIVQTKENPIEKPDELKKTAGELFGIYSSHIDEATSQIQKEFGHLDSKAAITGRAKSEKSILSKLNRKYENNEITSINTDTCTNAIGDAYGTRFQMKSLSQDESRDIIELHLANQNVNYSDFVEYINGNKSNLDSTKIEILDEIHSDIINELKEKQTQEVVNQLIESIKSGKLKITELNNYGDEISAYFTAKQLSEIFDAYYKTEGKGISIVNHQDITSFDPESMKVDAENTFKYDISVNTKKAIKQSGYTSAQMNTKHTFSDGTTGNGEFQIRGINVNALADVEHIPYDIKQGKIGADNVKYSDIYGIIKNMSNETYKKYNDFLTQTYRSSRLNELGIPSKAPDIRSVFSKNELSDKECFLLSVEGLIEISKRK